MRANVCFAESCPEKSARAEFFETRVTLLQQRHAKFSLASRSKQLSEK